VAGGPGPLSLWAETERQKEATRTDDAWATVDERILAACHPKQRAFVEDPSRRVAAIVGRGGGKTTGGKARLLLKMRRIPNARLVYIAETRGQAEELMWAPIKDLCEKLDIETRFNETKLKLTFPKNGSTLRLVGADNKREIDKLRGQPFHEVQIDEAASHTRLVMEYLLYRIIGPRLGDYGGVLLMYGTPGHLLTGPFYEATRTGATIGRPWEDRHKDEHKDFAGWSTHHWTLQDGAKTVPAMERLWAEALLEKATNGWSDDNPIWKREYLGLWAADDTENVYKYRPHTEDGEEWNQWDPTIHEKTGLAVLPEGDHDWRFVYGMDMGHSDPFALEVFAASLTTRTLYHVYEFEKPGMYARTIADQLLGEPGEGEKHDTDSPSGVIGHTGWPDGMVADTAGLGGAMLDELRNVYGIHIEAAQKKDKFDAIELFNGDLIDGHVKILKDSKLEEQLMSLQWAIDTAGKLKEDEKQRNDCTDAAIYVRRLAMHKFSSPPEAPGPDPGTPEALNKQMKDAENLRANPPDEWEDMLGDGGYSDYDGAYG
jgi:hypothetical protein